MKRKPFAVMVAALLLAASIACGNGEMPRPIPTPDPAQSTPTPRAIAIPADERSHNDRLEWWYYNGHLIADDGIEYGFHFVIFQSLDDAGAPVYAAQMSLTDVEQKEHILDSRLFAGDAEIATDEMFSLQINDWLLQIDSDSHNFSAMTGGGILLELELALDPAEQPVLQAVTGWFASSTGWSYYYSWPDMPATGQLTIGDSQFSVTGTGWFDHQWGDFFALGAPGGWQWMGLHLGEGETLMLAETRDHTGALEAVFGTWSDGDGTIRSLTEADGISIEVLETWQSPNTGGEYPSRWRVIIESLDVDVEVEPVLADQEVDEGVPQAAIYWEGKVRIEGSYEGNEIQQPGYVELTGYVPPSSIPWRNQ